jgi:uncharacterized membrane-anchored protein YhcB (DUF1043 family)
VHDEKKTLMNLLLLAAGIISMGSLAMPAQAQDAGKTQELQRIIEKQQKQLEAQQKQLDEQKQLLKELEAQLKSLAKDEDRTEVVVTAEKSPATSIKSRPQKKAWISSEDRHDQESPTGVNISYYDPTKTINIPGTNTSIGLHGLVQFQIIHDSDGQNNNRFDTASIPVDGTPSQTKFSINPTRIALSTTTPVTQGRFNTMISMDFNGELDRPDPRLRIAYGEFVSDELGLGILGGQAYPTMLDLRAAPETLDFSGPAGLWQARQPLLRISKACSDTITAEVALETPENVSYLGADSRTRWPDIVAAGTWHTGGEYIKHVRVAGLIRDLRAEGNNGSTDSAVGWAVTGSTKVGLPFIGAKDNFKFTIHHGDGYGTQLKGGPKEGVFNAGSSDLETIGITGAYGGIQHFWSDRFRSNLVYGFVEVDNPGFVAGDELDSTNYFAVDLIWSPYKNVTVGVEYLRGRRENKDGNSGTADRLLFSSSFTF